MKPLLLLFALLAPAPASEAWWNRDWKHRRPVAVTNRLDKPLEKGYTIQVELDPDYLGLRDRSKADFSDWTLVHRGVPVPCLLQPGRAKVQVLSFRLAADIKAEGSDAYLLYYGNPAAPVPAVLPADIFEFHEDFARPEALAERFSVDKDLTCAVQDGALVVRECANGRNAATPCRIVFRKFPVFPGFELSFDLEMDSTDAAAAACLATIELKEAGAGDASIDKKVAELIERLGDDAWEDREKATRDLIALGRPAVARLSEAAKSTDAEIKWRATHVLKQIGDRFPAPLISAGVSGGDARLPVALSSVIGKNRATLKVKSGWPVKTRVTLQRDGDGDVKVQWDGRSPQSGQMPGEIREVGFSIYKLSASPLGTIRIDNIVVRRHVEDDSRPTSMIDIEETRP